MEFLGGVSKPPRVDFGNLVTDIKAEKQRKLEFVSKQADDAMQMLTTLYSADILPVDRQRYEAELGKLSNGMMEIINNGYGLANPLNMQRKNQLMLEFVKHPANRAALEEAQKVKQISVDLEKAKQESPYRFPYADADVKLQKRLTTSAYDLYDKGEVPFTDFNDIKIGKFTPWNKPVTDYFVGLVNASGKEEMKPVYGDPDDADRQTGWAVTGESGLKRETLAEKFGGSWDPVNNRFVYHGDDIPASMNSLGEVMNSFTGAAIEDYGIENGKQVSTERARKRQLEDVLTDVIKKSSFLKESKEYKLNSSDANKGNKNKFDATDVDTEDQVDLGNPNEQHANTLLNALNVDFSGVLEAFATAKTNTANINSKFGQVLSAKRLPAESKSVVLPVLKASSKQLGVDFNKLFDVVENSDGSYQVVKKKDLNANDDKSAEYTIVKGVLRAKSLAGSSYREGSTSMLMVNNNTGEVTDRPEVRTWLSGRGLINDSDKFTKGTLTAKNLTKNGGVYIPGEGYFTSSNEEELQSVLDNLIEKVSNDKNNELDIVRRNVRKLSSNNLLSYSLNDMSFVDAVVINIAGTDIIVGRKPSGNIGFENSIGMKHLGALLSSASNDANFEKEIKFNFGGHEFISEYLKRDENNGQDLYKITIDGESKVVDTPIGQGFSNIKLVGSKENPDVGILNQFNALKVKAKKGKY